MEIGCNFVREESWARVLPCQGPRKSCDQRFVPIFAGRPLFPKNVENASHRCLGGRVSGLHGVHQSISARVSFKVALGVEATPFIQIDGVTEMQCHCGEVGFDISPSGVAHEITLQCPEMRLRKLGPEVLAE
jgi:hypothetical protein